MKILFFITVILFAQRFDMNNSLPLVNHVNKSITSTANLKPEIPTKLNNATLPSSLNDNLFDSFNDIINYFGYGIEAVFKIFSGCALSFLSYITHIKPSIIRSVKQYRAVIVVVSTGEFIDYTKQKANFANLLLQHPTEEESCRDTITAQYSPNVARGQFIKCMKEVHDDLHTFSSLLLQQLVAFKINCQNTANIEADVKAFQESAAKSIKKLKVCVNNTKLALRNTFAKLKNYLNMHCQHSIMTTTFQTAGTVTDIILTPTSETEPSTAITSTESPHEETTMTPFMDNSSHYIPTTMSFSSTVTVTTEAVITETTRVSEFASSTLISTNEMTMSTKTSSSANYISTTSLSTKISTLPELTTEPQSSTSITFTETTLSLSTTTESTTEPSSLTEISTHSTESSSGLNIEQSTLTAGLSSSTLVLQSTPYLSETSSTISSTVDSTDMEK